MFSPVTIIALLAAAGFAAASAAEARSRSPSGRDKAIFENVKSAMMGSIRTSWEHGTAAGALLEYDYPHYSIYGDKPFKQFGAFPASVLQVAVSAVVRQGADGRLSQKINEGTDGASLDGASAGSAVLLGTIADPGRKEYWQASADKQLSYIINDVPRTKTGAISHRAVEKAYWADAVYMGPPFIAYYGAVAGNQSLLQEAFDQCRLYRDALLLPGPTGPLWGHLYSDDTDSFWDGGLWATGNAWGAMGMFNVAQTIRKSSFASSMTNQTSSIDLWVKEILDGTFLALTPESLVPNYVFGKPAASSFGDAAASAALAAVAYRAATISPATFGKNYTVAADKIRKAVTDGVDNLGLLNPVVDPVSWEVMGRVSTEGQAFALMMFSAWRDWLAVN